MIVTCESCKSRYKLDDSKISGRGAKITCPKCRHVFVVYATGASPVEAPSAPREPSPPPSPEWEDEEPTRIGMVSSGGGRGATAGPVVATTPSPAAKPPPPMLLQSAPPGLTGGATARANPTLAFPVDEGVRPAFAPPPPPPGLSSVSPGEAASRAGSLDFRKVGVSTWKVKVRIGLVYDFSDIKTLRKYITDGRVTPADVISYDGRNWKPIGEIPDLDVFFVETYDMLARQRAEAPPPEAAAAPPRPPPEAARPAPVPDAGIKDPFEEIRKNQRAAASQPRRNAGTVPVPAPPRSAGVGAYALVAVLVVALLGGAWWVYQGQTTPPPRPTPPTAATPPRSGGTAPAAAEADLRKKIQDELQQGLEAVEAAPETAPANPVAAPYELVPVGPRGAAASPDGAVPVSATASAGAAAAAASRPSGVVTAPTSSQKDATAADHEAIGDASARSGDWAGAARAYQNAVALDPDNGRLLRRLGEAQYRSGNVDAAQSTLQQAQSRGQKEATKLLAQIARDQGDTANATYLYQQYLAGNPKDAAEIERILAELTGGN